MLKAFNTLFYFFRSILNLPKAPAITLVFLAFFLFFKSEDQYHYIDVSKKETRMLEMDGNSYFAYLPHVFVSKTTKAEISSEISEKKDNKHFVGTAICIAPFYFTAHKLVLLSGVNADGYSIPYELAVLLAGLSFWFLGMWSVFRLLRKFDLSNMTIVFSLLGLTLATNLYYYIIFRPDFAPIYAFGVLAFLLLQVKVYVDRNDSKRLVVIGLLLGLIAVIRPLDVLIVLLIPFFFSSFKAFYERLQFIFKNQKIQLFLSVLLFLGIVAIQFLNVHQQTGVWRFTLDSVGEEAFKNVFNPAVFEVLFGFQKGFFIYTPFFILLIPGFIEFYRWNKFFFTGVVSFFVLFVFILASNCCLFDSPGLGMSAMTGIFAILIIPVALLFEKARGYFKVVLFLFLFTMMDVNTTYTYQLQNGIIPQFGMNKELFSKTFLQTGKRYEGLLDLQEPTFNQSKFNKKESRFYTPSTERWNSTKKAHDFEIERTGNPTPLHFIPDSTMRNSQIAVEVRYEVLLKDEKSVSSVKLFGYTKGKRVELSQNLLKYQIPRLNRFSEVKAQLVWDGNYGTVDSLEIVVENGSHGGLIKRLQSDFFVHK